MAKLETVETLRTQRDELLAALEEEHRSGAEEHAVYGARWDAHVAGCSICALIARIKGGG